MRDLQAGQRARILTVGGSGAFRQHFLDMGLIPDAFVMELPNYRLPGIRNVARLLWDKAKDFLTRAFTVIFVATIGIWFLQTFDLRLNVVTDSRKIQPAGLLPFSFVLPACSSA